MKLKILLLLLLFLLFLIPVPKSQTYVTSLIRSKIDVIVRTYVTPSPLAKKMWNFQ